MITTQKSFGSLNGFFTLLFLFQLVFGFGQEERQTNLNATNTDDQSNVYSASLDCIVAPEGFQKIDGYNGYYHSTTGTSIVMNVVKGKTIVDAEESLTEGYYKNIQAELLSKFRVPLPDGKEMLIVKIKLYIDGEPFIRYQGFTGGLNEVLWLLATLPEKYDSVVQGPLLNSFKTTKFAQR